MKITDVKATPVACSRKRSIGSKLKKGPSVIIGVVVEVLTDEGIVGLGETPAVLGGRISADIVESTKKSLIGKDVTDINLLLKMLYCEYSLGHLHMHAASWALSGIEMALWDIAAQRAGLPLYALWGGAYRRKIEFFGGIERQESLDVMTETAKDLAKSGFRVLYTKCGIDPDSDIEAVAAIRKGAPDPKIKIRVDFNQAYPTGVAIDTINRMAKYGMEFVDQPTIMYNIEALKDVKNRACVPIAAHESSWTMYELLNVLKANAVDYIHVDGRFDAGYTGARISAGIAEAAGVQCVAHSYFELGISFAMNLHFIASIPNCTLANQSAELRYLEDDIIKGGPFKFEGRYVKVPEVPGIGVALDPEKMLLYNEKFVKEIEEGGWERDIEDPFYGAMFMRPFFKDTNEPVT